MDLISDLGNDLAVAFLADRKNTKKLDAKELKDLISSIRSALLTIAEIDSDRLASRSRAVPVPPDTQH